ncbi:hypothetical protein [Halococcus saccharolyticus]|uniref:hypothetical protein n=1 Tax=Halococcus saccharolyticus TaxID=62319 RepID=UPI0009B5A13D|nr:hypothetical protein [Halococcus saccharolyticus]
MSGTIPEPSSEAVRRPPRRAADGSTAVTVKEHARAPAPHPTQLGFHGQFYRDGEPTRSMA